MSQQNNEEFAKALGAASRDNRNQMGFILGRLILTAISNPDDLARLDIILQASELTPLSPQLVDICRKLRLLTSALKG
jgi:hypothetical protein